MDEEMNGGGEDGSSSGCSGDDESSADERGGEPPCDIGILERLIRTHPIWYLPGIQRSGAVHLLQGKEEGTFIVRESSKPSTMAISVRLPVEKGPYIEHYLIECQEGKLSLETSTNLFPNIPSLIAHYSQCCDELPVALCLPHVLMTATSRQELASLALLGQEFWGSRLASAPSTPVSLPSYSLESLNQVSMQAQMSNSQSQPSLSTFTRRGQRALSSSHSSLSSYSKGQYPSEDQGHLTTSQSSLSSFGGSQDIIKVQKPTHLALTKTFSSGPPLSPLVLNLQPLSEEGDSPPAMSTFKGKVGSPMTPGSGKVPPPPPPRWCTASNNTYNIPMFNNTEAKVELRPEEFSLDASRQHGIISQLTSVQTEHMLSSFKCVFNDSNHVSALLSPQVEVNGNQTSGTKEEVRKLGSSKRRKKKKSTHYSESDISDIVESPVTYYRSSLADRISDYEDLWSNDAPAAPPPPIPSPARPELSTFRSPRVPQMPLPSTNQVEERTRALSKSESSLTDSYRLGETKEETEEKKETEIIKRPLVPTPSPLYAEPVDAVNEREKFMLVVKRVRKGGPRPRLHRHSDPNIRLPQLLLDLDRGGLEPIMASSQEELQNLSASMDNLLDFNKPKVHWKQAFQDTPFHRSRLGSQKSGQRPRGKPVGVPQIGIWKNGFNETSWQSDSSWEFLHANHNKGYQGSESEDDEDAKGFALYAQCRSLDTSTAGAQNVKPTVDDLILERYPDLKLEDVQVKSSSSCHVSDYDNVGGKDLCFNNKENPYYNPSSLSDDGTATEFSEPWDSSKWEPFLHFFQGKGEQNNNALPPQSLESHNPDIIEQLPGYEKMNPKFWKKDANKNKSKNASGFTSRSIVEVTGRALIDDNSSLMDSIPKQSSRHGREQLLCAPRLQTLKRNHSHTEAGQVIRDYVMALHAEGTNTFAKSVDHFIQCTKEGAESDPFIIMRNVRQFMSGIKNYLVKHGEGDFMSVVEKERNKLKETEFLNLDAILESSMHTLVLAPLREHIYSVLLSEFYRSGALHQLAQSVRKARSSPGIGIQVTRVPNPMSVSVVRHFLLRMEQVSSPLLKLENLLSATTALFMAAKGEAGRRSGGLSMNADDFLPLLMYTIVECGILGLEVEIEYMWALIHPSLHAGEGGYYLALWSGAVYVLKNLATPSASSLNSISSLSSPSQETRGKSPGSQGSSFSDGQGFLRILIPDEDQGSILSRTLPARPGMTTRDVSKMVAHKLHITNPQDFALYKLTDDEEVMLNDSDCPQAIKAEVIASGRKCSFVFKRIEAKIAWPKMTPPS
ncbi:unnamed protein product [Darwinula stevensoni]|uniref:Protein sprint n=1 Tax=Darwinula stevensoni TaxID=69355 RepID=A0A7R9A1R1_9CRUS|nr:unnamed protein product [Darwinula stevensoni]CAG0888234.1 unnamed protein product [Darwinula stevensoni]